jgi:hypothetical protein
MVFGSLEYFMERETTVHFYDAERQTSPLAGFVVIDLFLAECFKAGQFLVIAVVLFG